MAKQSRRPRRALLLVALVGSALIPAAAAAQVFDGSGVDMAVVVASSDQPAGTTSPPPTPPPPDCPDGEACIPPGEMPPCEPGTEGTDGHDCPEPCQNADCPPHCPTWENCPPPPDCGPDQKCDPPPGVWIPPGCPPDGTVDEAAGTCSFTDPGGNSITFDLASGEGTFTHYDTGHVETFRMQDAPPGGPDGCPVEGTVEDGICVFDDPFGATIRVDPATGRGTITEPDGTTRDFELPPGPPPDGLGSDIERHGVDPQGCAWTETVESDGTIVHTDCDGGVATFDPSTGEAVYVDPSGDVHREIRHADGTVTRFTPDGSPITCTPHLGDCPGPDHGHDPSIEPPMAA